MMNQSSFYRQEAQNIVQYKIIILGMSSTGKTCLLTRYQHNFYEDRGISTYTVDFNITKRPEAWYYYYDTCGQQRYKAIVSHYYKNSDACIIAYDVSNPTTFDEISFYYNQVKQLTEDSLLYIVGCKGDLERKVFDEDLGKKYKGIKHFITSAKLDKGVKEAFMQIEADLLRLKPKQVNQRRSNVIKPIHFNEDHQKDKSRKKGNKNCC